MFLRHYRYTFRLSSDDPNTTIDLEGKHIVYIGIARVVATTLDQDQLSKLNIIGTASEQPLGET